MKVSSTFNKWSWLTDLQNCATPTINLVQEYLTLEITAIKYDLASNNNRHRNWNCLSSDVACLASCWPRYGFAMPAARTKYPSNQEADDAPKDRVAVPHPTQKNDKNAFPLGPSLSMLKHVLTKEKLRQVKQQKSFLLTASQALSSSPEIGNEPVYIYIYTHILYHIISMCIRLLPHLLSAQSLTKASSITAAVGEGLGPKRGRSMSKPFWDFTLTGCFPVVTSLLANTIRNKGVASLATMSLFLTKQLRQTRVSIWADLNQSWRVFRSRPFHTSSLNSIPSDQISVSHIIGWQKIVRSNSNQQNENESTIVSFQLSFQFIELFSIELASPCVSPSSSHLSIPSLEVSAHPRPSANLRYVCSSSVVTTSLTGKTCRPRKFSDAFPG